MNSKDLQTRWNSGEMRQWAGRILDSMLKGRPFPKNGPLPDHEGRTDLRGFGFNRLHNNFVADIHAPGYRIVIIRDYVLKHFDLSHADLSLTTWVNCSFEDCLFGSADLSKMTLDNPRLLHSSFTGTDFSYSNLSGFNRKGPGVLRGLVFSRCDFTKAGFIYPEISECAFEDCVLDETQFRGSRLDHCRFTGFIKNAWFGGYYRDLGKISFLEKIFFTHQRKDQGNKMLQVDFREARLGKLFFNQGIDLSNCFFPEQEDYLKILGPDRVFSQVKEIVRGWESPYKERGLGAIDTILFPENKWGMKMDYISTDWSFEDTPADFGGKFFGLIKKVNNSLINFKS